MNFLPWRHRRQREAELERELRGHLELEAEDQQSAGASPEEAAYAARRALGNATQIKEDVRTAWGFQWLETLLQDLRYGLRQLRRSPGFTAVAVLTLALGIGANTAIFSIVDWLTLRLPPVTKPEHLTTLAAERLLGGWDNGFSYPDFVDVRNQSTSVFSDVAGAMLFQHDGLSSDGNDEPIWTAYVTQNFFQLLGIRPAMGNLIQPLPGKSVDDEPVLVLGYAYWQEHFAGDPHVIGKSVMINGHPVTLIGVAPKGFRGITSLMDTQGYLPLGMAPVTSDARKDFLTNRRDASGLTIITRMKRGVTLKSAQPILKVIAQRLSAQYPSTDDWRTLRAVAFGPTSPGVDPQSGAVVAVISALFLMLSGVVLILACLNIESLLLARASGRQHEMAIRAAVGARRRRLLRQVLTESLLLASLGGAAGIGLGLIGSRAMSSINIHMAVPLVLDFRFDWRVFAYAFSLALLTAIMVGVAPALRSTRGDLNNLLHESPRTGTVGGQRTHSILVAAQIGGSLMLLIVAGLFARSLQNAEHANLGFDPRNVMNFAVDPHQTGYDEARSREFLKNVLSRVGTLPGVKAASLAATVPMGGIHLGAELKIDGYQPLAGERVWAGYNAVTPRYFETMRIPFLQGRGFLESDNKNSRGVAIINQAMAEKYWHGEDPIGRRFVVTDDPTNSIEVIGEVKNSRTLGVAGPFRPYMYFPLAQKYNPQESATLQVRTTLPFATMNREVVSVIHSLAPAMPVVDVQTMSEALDTTLGLLLYRIGATLAALLGVLGFTLATVGVYGVVSYGARQRTHEIGVRMALGAEPTDVLRMIFRQGTFVVSAGLIAGIAAAAAAARLIGSLLVGVSPVDPLTYASVSVLMATVALLASYFPARRAMRVHPMVALRHE